LIGNFETDFYDEYLELTILYFLRVESDFKNFSFLIEYINYDVQKAWELIAENEKNDL
jgi:FAD synthase